MFNISKEHICFVITLFVMQHTITIMFRGPSLADDDGPRQAQFLISIVYSLLWYRYEHGRFYTQTSYYISVNF
jgi:hypothetical protein